MRKFESIKNRKAEISITILVIGVFVICTLALLSFVASTINVRKTFTGIGIMERANSEIEKDSLEMYYHEQKDKGFWPWSKEKIIFSVQYSQPP